MAPASGTFLSELSSCHTSDRNGRTTSYPSRSGGPFVKCPGIWHGFFTSYLAPFADKRSIRRRAGRPAFSAVPEERSRR